MNGEYMNEQSNTWIHSKTELTLAFFLMCLIRPATECLPGLANGPLWTFFIGGLWKWRRSSIDMYVGKYGLCNSIAGRECCDRLKNKLVVKMDHWMFIYYVFRFLYDGDDDNDNNDNN